LYVYLYLVTWRWLQLLVPRLSPAARAVPCVLILVVVMVASHDHNGHDVELLGVVGTAKIWERYWTWLRESGRSPRTIDSYRFPVWDWFDFLGLRPWHKGNGNDLRRYLDRPARGGRARGRRLGPNTRQHYAKAIVGLYRFAYESGQLRRNPMATFRLPRGGAPLPRNFTLEQIRMILLAAVHDARLYCMVALGYYAGLRVAEIAALRIEEIHLEPLTPADEQDEQRPPGWLLVHGKGRKDRAVPIHPELHAAIVLLLTSQGWPRVGPLVVGRGQSYGQPMTPGSISRALSDHIRSVPDPTPDDPDRKLEGSAHGLRHSFATELLAAAGEENLYTVSKLLGHAGTAITEKVYVASYRGRPAEVLAKLPSPNDPRQPRKVNR
jgi:integrase